MEEAWAIGSRLDARPPWWAGLLGTSAPARSSCSCGWRGKSVAEGHSESHRQFSRVTTCWGDVCRRDRRAMQDAVVGKFVLICGVYVFWARAAPGNELIIPWFTVPMWVHLDLAAMFITQFATQFHYGPPCPCYLPTCSVVIIQTIQNNRHYPFCMQTPVSAIPCGKPAETPLLSRSQLLCEPYDIIAENPHQCQNRKSGCSKAVKTCLVIWTAKLNLILPPDLSCPTCEKSRLEARGRATRGMPGLSGLWHSPPWGDIVEVR